MEGGDSGKPRPRLILKIHSNGLRFSSSSAFKVWRREDDQGGCNTNIAPSSNLQIHGGAKSKCSVCSKTFHSEKALHGHMRCHPDRDWRGASSNTTHSSSDIPRWCKTGRRGQNCIIDSASSSPIITSLHQKRMEQNHRSGHPSKKPRIRAQGQDKSSLETRQYKCKTCHKVFPTLQDLVRNDSYMETPAMGNGTIMYAAASSRTTAPPEVEGLPLASTFRHVQKSHKCKICHKTFPSGQALGGHQTIHRPKLAQPEPATPAPQQEPVFMLTFHEEAERPRVLEFDLNELPPVDEEEQHQNLCCIVHPLS